MNSYRVHLQSISTSDYRENFTVLIIVASACSEKWQLADVYESMSVPSKAFAQLG